MIELVEFFIHRSYNHHNNRLITKQIFLFELTRALKINFENKFDIKKNSTQFFDRTNIVCKNKSNYHTYVEYPNKKKST